MSKAIRILFGCHPRHFVKTPLHLCTPVLLFEQSGTSENMKSQREQQRLRRAPPAILTLIDIANDVPDEDLAIENDRTFPPEPTEDEITLHGGFQKAWEAAFDNQLEQKVLRLGAEARKYILAGDGYLDRSSRYEEVRRLRVLLDAVASYNQSKSAAQKVIFTNCRTELSIHQGRLSATNLLGVALSESGFDRIKRCAYQKCRRFFWAGRLDKPCCEESCRRAHKQQRHREQQRRNQAYKKFQTRRKVHG
jgi:hypothetical protein